MRNVCFWRFAWIRPGELCLKVGRPEAGQKEGPKAVGDRSSVLRSSTHGGRPAAWPPRPGPWKCCQQWRILRHGKHQSSSLHLPPRVSWRGSFFNYVDKMLLVIDHLPTSCYLVTITLVRKSILLPKLFWTTVKKNCSSDLGKRLIKAKNLQNFGDY